MRPSARSRINFRRVERNALVREAYDPREPCSIRSHRILICGICGKRLSHKRMALFSRNCRRPIQVAVNAFDHALRKISFFLDPGRSGQAFSDGGRRDEQCSE
ncbi:MAG: hypothetical protein ABFD60_10275, partial [Bryobacteraceae bacterium]